MRVDLKKVKFKKNALSHVYKSLVHVTLGA